jgi:hypothetical protein
VRKLEDKIEERGKKKAGMGNPRRARVKIQEEHKDEHSSNLAPCPFGRVDGL